MSKKNIQEAPLAPKEVGESKGFDTIKRLLDSKEHKGTNYGFIAGKDLFEYQDEYISTGSVRMDVLLGGGYRSGMSVFFGDEETGKTAQGLVWAKNWQDKYGEKGIVMFFDAEGRLSDYKINMSGIDRSRFGLYRGNLGEKIYDSIERTILDNPEGFKYFFILDSIDAILRQEDKDKSMSDPSKIAGGAALNSIAYKRLSAPLHCLGHHLYMCSQVRTQRISGGPEAPKPSGGKATRFYGDIVGRVHKGYSDTFIKDGEKVIGNKTRIQILKSYNEVSNSDIHIPVLYKHKGGVYREYEALLLGIEWTWIEKGGAWYNFTELFQNFVEKDCPGQFDLTKKMQGEKRILEFLTENPLLVDYMFAKFKAFSL